MITPMIPPSGITVDANVAEKLKVKNGNDIFDQSIEMKMKFFVRVLFNSKI